MSTIWMLLVVHAVWPESPVAQAYKEGNADRARLYGNPMRDTWSRCLGAAGDRADQRPGRAFDMGEKRPAIQVAKNFGECRRDGGYGCVANLVCQLWTLRCLSISLTAPRPRFRHSPPRQTPLPSPLPPTGHTTCRAAPALRRSRLLQAWLSTDLR